MKNHIKILLIALSIISGNNLYSSEIPVYTGSQKTYMPVTVNSNFNGEDDGVIISWFEEINNGSIMIQKVSTDGHNMWAANGVLLETGLGSYFSEETDYPFLFSDKEGGALIIYRKQFFNREDIFAKQISKNGVVENKPVLISSRTGGYNYSPSAALTSDGKIAVVWENFSEGDFNIHGQLIDLRGNKINKIWNKGEPIEICGAPDEQRRPEVNCDENNNLIISWLDSRKHTEYVFDVYARIIDANSPDPKDNPGGTMIFRNDISSIPRKLTMFDINAVPIDKSSFLVAFEYSYDNQFSDLKIIKVSNELEIEWEKLITSDSDQKDPYIAPIDINSAGIFWNDISNDHNEIFGFVVGKDGNILWGGENGRRISYDESQQILEKVMPFSKNPNASYFQDGFIYLTWTTKELKKLYVSSIHLTDGSVSCISSELLQEKISEGEYTSITAHENNLMIVYKQSDYIQAAKKDIAKQGITKIAEIPVINNYPNPFNPATKINFKIPADGFVRLSVYDITGRLVNELINEFKTKGDYQVSFNGNNLSSGVYFYRLEADGKSYVQKMTLIK